MAKPWSRGGLIRQRMYRGRHVQRAILQQRNVCGQSARSRTNQTAWNSTRPPCLVRSLLPLAIARVNRSAKCQQQTFRGTQSCHSTSPTLLTCLTDGQWPKLRAYLGRQQTPSGADNGSAQVKVTNLLDNSGGRVRRQSLGSLIGQSREVKIGRLGGNGTGRMRRLRCRRRLNKISIVLPQISGQLLPLFLRPQCRTPNSQLRHVCLPRWNSRERNSRP